MRLSFELQADVQEVVSGNAPDRDQVILNLTGKLDTYTLGLQRWVSYEWPSNANQAELRIRTTSGSYIERPEYRQSGDWAMFRLLDLARPTPRGTLYELRWPFEMQDYSLNALYTLRTQGAAEPLVDPRSFFNYRPPQTLGSN
jgi:type VI protein secretion system component VasK